MSSITILSDLMSPCLQTKYHIRCNKTLICNLKIYIFLKVYPQFKCLYVSVSHDDKISVRRQMVQVKWLLQNHLFWFKKFVVAHISCKIKIKDHKISSIYLHFKYMILFFLFSKYLLFMLSWVNCIQYFLKLQQIDIKKSTLTNFHDKNM